MGRAVRLLPLPETATAAATAPPDPPSARHDLIVAETAPTPIEGGWRYGLDEGPFRSYERRLELEGDRWRETTEWRLSIPYFGMLFEPLVRRALRSPVPVRSQWWAPAVRLGAGAAELLGRLGALAAAVGFLGGLLTQTLTFAAADLGAADRSTQGGVLALNRVGIVLLVIGMWIADRRGRRVVGVWSLVGAAIAALATAAAPSLWTFAALQLLCRNLALTAGMAFDTIGAEELPAGARAYASAVTSMAVALGAGGVVLGLRLADLSPGGWRYVFLLSLPVLPLIAHAGRRLPESRRFEQVAARRAQRGSAGAPTPDERARDRLRPSRLVGLGLLFMALNVLVAPSSQFQNEYLRTVHGFSGGLIAVFTICTSTPAGLGVLLGGQLADRRGRRRVILVGLAGLGMGTTMAYSNSGALLWVSTLVGNLIGALLIPTLGVLSAELFPTANRGIGRAVTSVAAVSGSIVGLLGAGWLLDQWSFGRTFSLLAGSLLVVAAVVVWWVPETARRELEELNP